MALKDRFSKNAFKLDLSNINRVFPQITANVEMERNGPVLKINGKKENPIFFFGNTESIHYKPFVNEEIRMASERGVHLHTVVIHFPVVPEGCERNFEWVDNIMDYVLDADKNARIIIRVPLYPHDKKWWNENLHGDILEYSDGSSSLTWWETFFLDDLIKFKDGTTSIPSMASDEWMKQAILALDAGIDYIAAHPVYSACVIGYHPTYGSTGEWFYMDYREKGCDHSLCNRIGFRRWLKEKYENEVNMSKAWRKTIQDIDAVEIPDIPNEFSNPIDCKVLLSEENTDVIDFYDYMNDINELRIEQLSEFIKIKTNNQSLVMVFYGYNYELPDPKSGHGYLQELLECGFVDMLASPISYQERGEGGVMAYMAPVDSIQLHGVIWMVEDDTRTHRAINFDEIDSGFNPTIGEKWITKEIHKRNFASIIKHSNGMWWMDLWGSGWLLDNEMWDDNKKLIDEYQSYTAPHKQLLPEVAFVINEKNAFYMNNPGKHQTDLIYKSNIDIYRCGLSVGYYTFDDAINGRLPKSIKLYIFLNAIHISETQIDKIKNNLMKNGNSLLFNYGAGVVDQLQTVDLLGMNLIPFDTKDYSPMFYVEKSDGLDILEYFEDKDIDNHNYNYNENNSDRDNDNYNGKDIYNDNHNDIDNVDVDANTNAYTNANDAEHGENSKKISIAGIKELDYTMVFCSYPTVIAERLRKIARYCNVHVYCETNDCFIAGADILSIHAKTNGLKTIKLPQISKVRNMVNGEIWATDTIQIHMEAFTTAIYFYEEIKNKEQL